MRPMVATEEAIPALKMAPTRRPRAALLDRATSTWRASELSATGARASDMTRMPRKTRPKPSTTWPRLLARPRRAKKVRAKPTPTRSRASSCSLKAMSCTVNVVPMSAPRITPRDWRKVRSPAETKPISIRVVADEDWMSVVTRAPEQTAVRRLLVMLMRMCRSWLPAARWSPSPQSCMPYRSRARPPKRPRSTMSDAEPRGGERPACREPGQVSRAVDGAHPGRGDFRERAVRQGEPPDRRQGQPEAVREVCADDAAVTDHESFLAIRMGGGDGLHGAHHPCLHVAQRLGARGQVGDGVAHPLRVRIAGTRADLLHGLPFPLAQGQLAEIVDVRHGEPEPLCGNLGRSARPREWARVDGDDAASAQGLAEGRGLADTPLGERDVQKSLEATHGVGQGLAVASEQQTAHRELEAARCAAFRRTMVSGLPRMPATWKIGGLAALPVSAMRVSCARSTSLSPISEVRPR